MLIAHREAPRRPRTTNEKLLVQRRHRLKTLFFDEHQKLSRRLTLQDDDDDDGFHFSSFRSAANHNQSNRASLLRCSWIKPKEVTNIGILLRALNVARDEVVEALSDGK